jgi:flagellar hook-basal body complex protein FliE
MNINPISPVSAQRTINQASGINQADYKQFSDKLKNAMNNFTENLESANDSLNKTIVGDSEHYLDFLIQTEKNAMNLQVTLQVRNKVVDAYNEIMRMQL